MPPVMVHLLVGLLNQTIYPTLLLLLYIPLLGTICIDWCRHLLRLYTCLQKEEVSLVYMLMLMHPNQDYIIIHSSDYE